MVYFVCSTCGTCLKKNQVTTHWYKCRQGKHVSCMDCGKDFWGEDYASHVKCITEDEKYGGSNYVSKENKGEKKQEEWVTKIKEKVATSQNMEPQLRELLQKIVLHSNIPRKEAKFRNFMRSSCRVSNPKLVDKVWEVFKDANTKTDVTNGVKNGLGATETDNSGNKNESESVKGVSDETDQNCNDDTKKLNKRERKELRREKQSKKSKKDKHNAHSNNTESGTKRKLDTEEEETNLETAEPRKKKKKRKGDDLPLEEEHMETMETTEPKKKKKRKGDDVVEEIIPTTNKNNNAVGEDSVIGEESEEPAQPQSTSVFKWTVAIRRVLQNGPEEGLKVSKLQRKVFSLYYAAHGEDSNVKSQSELIGTLHKKLNKKKEFFLYKDKVKLQK